MSETVRIESNENLEWKQIASKGDRFVGIHAFSEFFNNLRIALSENQPSGQDFIEFSGVSDIQIENNDANVWAWMGTHSSVPSSLRVVRGTAKIVLNRVPTP